MKILKCGKHAVCKLIVLSCVMVGTASVANAQRYSLVELSISMSVASATALDMSGLIIGQFSNNKFTVDSAAGTARISVLTRKAPPPNVTMSRFAPAFTATPQSVVVTVPATLPVGFCVSGDYYDRHTALCADGNPPYKIVPIISLAEPAAEIPNVICDAPKIPTFNSSTKKWACIVPAGFKLTM
jgi:hypothetical protein